MTTTNDAQAPVTTALLPRAQAGDDRAMNDILLHIAPFVGRLCLPIAQSHSSDAAQEAMLAIFRGIRGLREPEAFYGWVRAVTVREAVRTSKRLSQGPTDDLTDRALDGNPWTPSTSPTPWTGCPTSTAKSSCCAPSTA